ncbi:fused MFS/spermidine synthase [Terriglobus aquaticus]|uniref:Fused MFS/spermidine synthase n=1 Tax=Terriglobus aquaticus TaxID=940139 RepID=A0ABW9KLW0_9BACT
MRIAASLQQLLVRLRALVSPPRVAPCFRDPVLDFGITATSPLALEHAPEVRHGCGAYVSEHGNYLSLYLGGSTVDGVHAVMDCTAPAELVFSYTQIMAGFSRFVPHPHHIGMLGLGGGSLAKHCYEAFPESRITIAEISPEVIGLRGRFLIPDDDERLCVLLADGAKLVANSRDRFDVLLVDAFNEGGHMDHLGTVRFYRNCHRALTPSGILVLNFSGDAWQGSLSALHRLFRDQVVLYRCPDGDNVIAFAGKATLASHHETVPLPR